ncbi:unnamed protein product [Diamesa tonsa]
MCAHLIVFPVVVVSIFVLCIVCSPDEVDKLINNNIMIDIQLTPDLKICVDCNNQLITIIDFISTTKLSNEMYQELETKEENYLFTDEIINEIRASYNLTPIELQDKVNITEESQDIVKIIYCEPEENVIPSMFIIKDVPETRVSKRIASSKSSTKKETKKMNFQPKNFEFICHICRIEFKGLRPLAKHTKEEHNCKPQVECVCGKKIFNNQTLINHREKHFHQSPAFTCKSCSKAYWSQATLTIHESKCSGVEVNVPRIFTCKECSKEFPTSHQLRYHLLVHLPDDKKKFSCSYCERNFPQEFQLKKHLLVHEGEKTYICETCGVGFKRNSSLQCHRETHLFNYTPENSCTICAKKFRNKRLLSLHLPTHAEKIFGCDHCDKMFRTKRNLFRHLATLAIGNARNFVCHLCTNTYKYSKDLKYHITVTHLNEKQHACQFCDKTFGTSRSINTNGPQTPLVFKEEPSLYTLAQGPVFLHCIVVIDVNDKVFLEDHLTDSSDLYHDSYEEDDEYEEELFLSNEESSEEIRKRYIEQLNEQKIQYIENSDDGTYDSNVPFYGRIRRNTNYLGKVIHAWFRNGEQLLTTDPSDDINGFKIFSNGTLKINSTNQTAGSYRCMAKHSLYNIGAIISREVIVEEPDITKVITTPATVEASEGSSVVIICPISSLPAANITWHFNSSLIEHHGYKRDNRRVNVAS